MLVLRVMRYSLFCPGTVRIEYFFISPPIGLIPSRTIEVDISWLPFPILKKNTLSQSLWVNLWFNILEKFPIIHFFNLFRTNIKKISRLVLGQKTIAPTLNVNTKKQICNHRGSPSRDYLCKLLRNNHLIYFGTLLCMDSTQGWFI